MQIFSNKTAVALGYFDGVHLGHREIIRRTFALAEQYGATPIVLTFRFDGERLAAKGQGDIYPYDARAELLKQSGVQSVVCDSFDSIRSLTAEQFFGSLVTRLKPVALCCGDDYRFGCDRADVETLRTLCSMHGVELCVLSKLSDTGGEISSTRIKAMLATGDLNGANGLLGREYALYGTVSHGRRVGTRIGFPTVNLPLDGLCVPRAGVYASSTELDGKAYKSITNIGVRPTFIESGAPVAETHIIDYEGDAYGKQVKVTLKRFLRDERRFDCADELIDTIRNDIEQAKKYSEAL